MVYLLGTKLGLPESGATMKVSIHKGNAGTLVLAENLPLHSMEQTLCHQDVLIERPDSPKRNQADQD